MFAHDLLCLSFLVSTTNAGTPHETRPFSLRPCPFQELVGLLNPFIGHASSGYPARIHPLTVIHLRRYQRLLSKLNVCGRWV